MAEYRDARGRFSSERRAVFKRSDGRTFMRLFGVWAELKPVTAESFRESTDRYFRAMQAALAESPRAH